MSRYLKQYKLKPGASLRMLGHSMEQVQTWCQEGAPFICVQEEVDGYSRYLTPSYETLFLDDERFEPFDVESTSEPEPVPEDVDMVNHPPHYLNLGMEVKDIIKEVVTRTFGATAYKAYCLGNELKYRLRAGDKGDALEDLGKAKFYRTEREKEKAHEGDSKEADWSF